MPYIGQFAGAAVGGEKGKRIAETSAAFGELLGMTGKITKAFGSPSTGLKIADGKLGDLGESTGMINPKGFGAFDGALPEGISGAFGGKNTLPERIGETFKSPGWNAQESIFKPPGETKPFDWSLFK